MARKILLADDSVTAQNMGRRILTDAGYEVITVNNGSAAIKKIAEVKPDIVMLDVYMPGYGGLEICQRIRETPELARIPVLLTVGKLEPFRAEDSLRVRADAFVIKPFEASELLTALTKLEDKIVPSAQPFSGGRFARAIAAVENSAGGAREFGDADTGWKSRIKIPAPYSKPHPAHAESQPGAVVSDIPAVLKAKYLQTENLASILLDPAVAGLPHDVTPEEIAAITAAAAILSGRSRLANEPVKPVDAPEPTESEPVSAFAVTAEADLSSASFAPQDQQQNESVEAVAQIAPEVSPKEKPEVPAEIAAGSGPDPVTEPKLSGDEEVTAALDALSPSTTNRDRDFSSQERRSAKVNESAPFTMASAGESSGPRWIAAEVSVPEDESALVLQLEMQRAYAAFAAADAARSIVGDYAREDLDEPAHQEPVTVVQPSESSDAPVTCDVSPQVEEAAKPAEEASPASAIADASPQPVAPVGTSPAAAEAEPETKAAHAVASASAGDSFGSASTATSLSEIFQVPAEVSEPVSHPRDRELAAAWANWKQVREAAAGPEPASQIAETSSESLRESHHQEPAHHESATAEVPEESGEEAGEIADIVDSVLADLKPKLMKEISQKMGKGKRKK